MAQPKRLKISRQPNEIAQDYQNYLYRIVPAYVQPYFLNGTTWRNIVKSQPIAMICRDTLISNIISLDWKVVARDSNQQDELKPLTKHYTKLFESGYDGYDYTEFVEWLGQDLLDLPFGFAAEIGRQGNKEGGRVEWIHPIDGATLFPTPDYEWPIGQRVDGVTDIVYFPKYAISRIFMTPHTDILLEGWGMSPPEKIYLALEMINRGDKYYANLLLDTPSAGILDLGDMEQESAKKWLDSWRSLMQGIDGFKIPVLYEHTTQAKFIPFGKPPADLMFDRITMKYAAITCAGYQMTLSDIGLAGVTSSGGETLAGAIRSERRSRKSGLAVFKRKMCSFFNQILPESLEFKLIDYDDEVSVAVGRARLANAQAFKLMMDSGYISAEESRLQSLADGIFTINMPEEIPPEAKAQENTLENPRGRDTLGRPKPPSQGGWGEIKPATTKSAAEDNLHQPIKVAFDELLMNMSDVRIRRLVRVAAKAMIGEIKSALTELYYNGSDVEWDDVERWNDWHDDVLFENTKDIPDAVSKALTEEENIVDAALEADKWWDTLNEADDLAAIFAALLLAYQNGMNETAIQLTSYLYEVGLSPFPNPQMNILLKNEAIKSVIGNYGRKIIERTNSGTKFYLRRIVMSEVRRALSKKEIADGLMSGTLDLEQLFDDNIFMKNLVNNITRSLRETLEMRLYVIPSSEEVSMTRMATVDMLRKSNLNMKQWVCLGVDPCPEYCIPNQEEGLVPLDFVYRASFPEGVLQPQAHGRCHCAITFSKEEVKDFASKGNFTIWTGE